VDIEELRNRRWSAGGELKERGSNAVDGREEQSGRRRRQCGMGCADEPWTVNESQSWMKSKEQRRRREGEEEEREKEEEKSRMGETAAKRSRNSNYVYLQASQRAREHGSKTHTLTMRQTKKQFHTTGRGLGIPRTPLFLLVSMPLPSRAHAEYMGGRRRHHELRRLIQAVRLGRLHSRGPRLCSDAPRPVLSSANANAVLVTTNRA